MKVFLSFSLIFTIVFTAFSCNQINAQTTANYSRNAKILQEEKPVVKILKREVIPGAITFTRQNGCLLKIPVSTFFLDNEITLKTPVNLAVLGNSIPKWRNEYRQPWMSKLTDYQMGEYKMMIFQIGKHPSSLIRLEESEQQLVDSQILCAVAAYKIFGSNIRLLQEIPNQKGNSLSLPFNLGWERLFYN